jgi:hypothetical protein
MRVNAHKTPEEVFVEHMVIATSPCPQATYIV